jgi:hypothetical protein
MIKLSKLRRTPSPAVTACLDMEAAYRDSL